MHNSIDNNWPKTAFQILEAAANIIAEKFVDSDAYCNPSDTKDFLRFKMSKYEREVFALMLLDGQHRLIEFQELFFGSISSATVHPREVVKAVLNANAAAVILAHNHPSGVPEPSQADISLTKRIKESLQLIDVPVLDHIVVGKDCVSLAERGLV